jgi:hypothetical protein
MGYAVAGIIAIIAGVLAWLSTKTWRWYNVALAYLVVCAAATFGYLAANTLKAHNKWRSAANTLNADIAKEEAAHQKLLTGVRDENGRLKNGLQQLKREVQDLIVRRGQAWFDVKPVSIAKDGSGAVTVEIGAPEPHGMVPQSVVYVFEVRPIGEGGSYLGEFKVTEAPAGSKEVQLVPNLELTPAQVDRLSKTQGDWTIYLKMPNDENAVFAALPDADAESIVPKDFPEAYRKGQRPEADMTDWVYRFHEYALQRELLGDEMTKIKNNISRLEESEKRNQEKIAYRTEEKGELEFDLQGFDTERKSVAQLATELDAKAKKFEHEESRLRASIAKLAAELKAIQTEAADRINAQTATAQAGP